MGVPDAGFGLFERFGVEIEYMIVDRDTLQARPIADRVLQRGAALPGAAARHDDGGAPEFPNEVELGAIAWSNELVLHVLELKTAAPAPSLHALHLAFAEHARTINALLERDNAMLLGTGMHPTFDPLRETKLWPHDYSPVYEAFNRIFDCRGHGWSNLQACHLNLPFSSRDEEDPGGEFGRLHAAVRALLPILPALAASTPVVDGAGNGVLDNRLEVYRINSRKIASATGRVIPEPVYTRRGYEREILQRIYDEYAPHDPEGVLRDEWANSRGAIARFSRRTIEVRVIDAQECPRCDLAIAHALAGALRAIIEGRVGDLERCRALAVDPLHATLLACIRAAGAAEINDREYLAALGIPGAKATAAEAWRHLLPAASAGDPHAAEWLPVIEMILTRGCLARRIVSALGKAPTRAQIISVYRRLAGCLASNSPFLP